MARPSVKAERTEAILQAYERCVARLGVEGATLEKIAAEAGMARALLRHHVGNRDELLRMAIRRFTGRSDQAMRELRFALPEGATGRDLLELILPPVNPEAFSSDVMIAAAFIYAAQSDRFLRQTMQSWLENFLESFASAVQAIYPQADPVAVQCVTAGISGIWFNVDSLAALGANRLLREHSRQAALVLLHSLESGTEAGDGKR